MCVRERERERERPPHFILPLNRETKQTVDLFSKAGSLHAGKSMTGESDR